MQNIFFCIKLILDIFIIKKILLSLSLLIHIFTACYQKDKNRRNPFDFAPHYWQKRNPCRWYWPLFSNHWNGWQRWNACAFCRKYVQFSVDGDGTTAGVDNGNPVSHESLKCSVMQAFNGKCLVVMQAGEKARSIIVNASAPGLKSASMIIISDQCLFKKSFSQLTLTIIRFNRVV